jgi:hypothetical protein
VLAETFPETAPQRLKDAPSAARQRTAGPRSDETSAFEMKTAVIVLCVISLALGGYYLASGDRALALPGAILIGASLIALALARR